MKRRFLNRSGLTIWDSVLIVFILAIVAAVLFPMFARTHCCPRKASCQNNMKELGLTLIMYYGDYDATLPSSALNGSAKWDPDEYRQFATERGVTPPEIDSKPVTWVTALYPYMKNKDIFRCPSDPEESDAKVASYWWKAAIDRAWFDGKRRDGDFKFPADQIVFYERAGWHWGDQAKGLSNDVTVNVTFIDGHVVSKRLTNAGNAVGKSDPLAPGEPGWFNYDMKHSPVARDGTARTVTGTLFNPRLYGDKLP